MEKLAYSVMEVAQMTSLSKSFIRNEIKDGHLLARRINRRVIILAKDVNDYLEGRLKDKVFSAKG